MLCHCLAGTETSGDGNSTTLGKREQCVDYPESCDKRDLKIEMILNRTRNTDRPMLDVDGTVQDGVAISCAPGDRVRLTYVCTDGFGLRYEFPLYEQEAMRWDDLEECPLSRTPSLAWPE